MPFTDESHVCEKCREVVEHRWHVCVPVDRQPWNLDYARVPLSGRARDSYPPKPKRRRIIGTIRWIEEEDE